MKMNWLCQVWGQGEHMCNNEKSLNTSLYPFCLNSKTIEMNSKPFGNLNHHMHLQHLAPCQVWKSNDKAKLHDVYKNWSWAITKIHILTHGTIARKFYVTWHDTNM